MENKKVIILSRNNTFSGIMTYHEFHECFICGGKDYGNISCFYSSLHEDHFSIYKFHNCNSTRLKIAYDNYLKFTFNKKLISD